MKRCRAEGAEYFALFVGAAVLANNLMIVAALLTRRSLRRSKSRQPQPYLATANQYREPRVQRSQMQTMVSLGPVHGHN